MKMKSRRIQQIITFSIVAFLFSACVPARQFEDLKKKESNCQDENKQLRSDNEQFGIKNTELSSQVEELSKNVKTLVNDTTTQGISYRRLTDLYNELTKSYEKLLSNNERLLAGNTEETKRLIAQLIQIKEDLIKKEDKIKKDSLSLAERELRVSELQANLNEKDARVRELQDILNRGDSAVNALRKVVSDALLGFQGAGLTVDQREGRVYVSMEERLLFASGSTSIEKKGEEALKELSKVLVKNKDINILVEGHTDNVPISGTLPSGAKDNWELSVLRATSVVKIILSGSEIDPSRLTAAGRGPYKPIDTANTSDARKKNRRTEIVLSPKLDELMKLLDQINQTK
ncbi:MAG TPA: OmpA family protein [Bacteroidia bacterium]|nr:OmpA family protein [Bacteroidia bacterium]HNS12438.1 OmpA family protein [Bacteroidia bacterium]